MALACVVYLKKKRKRTMKEIILLKSAKIKLIENLLNWVYSFKISLYKHVKKSFSSCKSVFHVFNV